jgi:ABC-2 type transport system ATP-binding protein
MNDFVIETVGLRRAFGGHLAVDGLDLAVPRGSIFGFLGRNGAGKTTTIRLLLGFLRSGSGEARVLGDLVAGPDGNAALRRRIGYVSENKYMYPYMTVGQIIRFTRPFFPRWHDDLERRYLEIFNLPLNRKVSALSKGMRTCLMLLLAMSHDAELLILDEPIEGLDPAVIETLLKELAALPAAEGTTIFFSSHQLAEVEQIADRIAIIDRGRNVLANGRTVSILASRNVEAIVKQARSLPGASVERYPVSLKEIFLEHLRSN